MLVGSSIEANDALGIVGLGAFGRLMAHHLAPHGPVWAHDPAWPSEADFIPVRRVGLAEAARCDVVVLAVPVGHMAAVAAAIAPHLRPGALVVDVGSVKVEPAAALLRTLPAHVEVLATHPLFGPESARAGLRGHTVALCPLRGRRWRLVARFLRRRLGLRVVVTTPDAHDRDLAVVQGLTHLVGRLVAAMGPLPTRLTTRSFELLTEAAAMVGSDAPEVFDAILRRNPHASDVRARFFEAAARLAADLETPATARADAVLTSPSPRASMLPAWSSAPESAPSWCP